MAVTINAQDLENYPGIVKRVSVDSDKIVPLNYEGDERFVIIFSTPAYSDNVGRTAIQSSYVTEFKAGWIKSSGFAGSGGKFYITDTNKYLKVKIDETTGGDGSGYYTIELTPNSDNTPVTGSSLADDLEEKIRLVELDAEDIGFTLAYRNASVYYSDGKIWIVSGSFSKSFSGTHRSSVAVADVTTSGCADILGFDLYTSSQMLDGIAVKESIVTQSYTADTDTLYVSAGTGVQSGDVMMITDRVNTDYFQVLSVTDDTEITVPTNSTNGFTGISNNYNANEAKVQLLREGDPEGKPRIWHDSMDSIIRHGVKSIINQIDFSS